MSGEENMGETCHMLTGVLSTVGCSSLTYARARHDTKGERVRGVKNVHLFCFFLSHIVSCKPVFILLSVSSFRACSGLKGLVSVVQIL